MKKSKLLGGIGVILIILVMLTCCCTKKDNNLVTFDNTQELNFQIKTLKQFDSLVTIIEKQSKLIDSISKIKTNISYVDKIIVQKPLTTKYTSKQIDSIIQSNKNLLNIIKHQNAMIKK